MAATVYYSPSCACLRASANVTTGCLAHRRTSHSSNDGVRPIVPQSVAEASTSGLFSSPSSFSSQFSVSSNGVGVAATDDLLPAGRGLSNECITAYSEDTASLRSTFEELTSGLGSQMDDSLFTLIAASGSIRASGVNDITQWQADVQPRHLRVLADEDHSHGLVSQELL